MLGIGVAADAIGLPQGDRLGRSAWWRSGALIDVDFAGGRFAHAGRDHADEAGWLAAIGGSAAGGAMVIGPALVGDGTNRLVNGTFDMGTTGWTVSNGGAISAVDGELRLSGGSGNTTALYQGVAIDVGRAYRYRVRQRKVGGTQNPNATLSPNSGLGGTSVSSTVTSALMTLTQAELFGSASYTTIYVGSRQFGNPDAPTNITAYDDAELVEVMPLPGWQPGAFAARIDGRTPAVAGTEHVVLQADDGAAFLGTPIEGNRVRLVWDATMHLRLVVTTTTTSAKVEQVNLDLGGVAESSDFTVELSAKAGRFVARRDGAVPVVAEAGAMPGLAFLRIGRGHAGSAWPGSLARVSVWAGERLPRGMLRAEGDSFVSGAGGVDLAETLSDLVGRGVVTTGAGGSAMTDVRNRLLAASNSGLRDLVTIIWDGSPNGLADTTGYLDQLADGIAALGHHRFVLVPSIAPYGVSAGGGTALGAIAIRDGMLARWPSHVLDWRDWIANSDGVVNQNRMLNYPSDSWHLNQLAMDEMAVGIANFLAGKGW